MLAQAQIFLRLASQPLNFFSGGHWIAFDESDLQQTAMNIGPTLGIAVAATLMSLTPGAGVGPPLTVLAVFSATAALLALGLPGHEDPVSTAGPSPADASPARLGR